ncbi:MAG TPA: hypothetical protein VD699_01515 [Nitrosopumilaceae archaeon]|nr:hypothetical protein [Nitrosopumilaceae archaeon]
MTYQEREISKNQLERAIQVLDLDEGIRIENKSNMIFINKSAKRYCINTSTKEKEEFAYCNSAAEVLDFLKENTDKDCKIFSY